MEEGKKITFLLRVLHNQIKVAIRKTAPPSRIGPRSQLQGGILGYLYHHQDIPVYQRDLEKEFRISRATATNTLQVMEREGLIVRRAQDKDARLKRIQLTEEAREGHKQMEAHLDRIGGRLLEGLSDTEVSQLDRLLMLLLQNLEGLIAECDESFEEPEDSCGSSILTDRFHGKKK